ncbi:rubber elongation factor protein (REF) [Tasmannia lanceolata]|uniref:rubber elongation factor protein (REF) n=1 Tax=Tasmannia lanceolata TaxID=3420 RepID=UPI00406326A6
MATNTIESENGKRELKHLGFIKIAAINAFIFVINLYEYAKERSGPLRSGVSAVDSTITTIVGPVWEKFGALAEDLLVFVDNEVDKAGKKFEQQVPALLKNGITQTQSVVQRALQLAHELASKARTGSVSEVANTNEVIKCKQIAERQLLKLWFALDQVTLFHMAAEMAVPTAARWLDKYNHLVTDMSQKGFPIFTYLPLIPLDRIAKKFKREEAAKGGAAAAADGEEASRSSDSE